MGFLRVGQARLLCSFSMVRNAQEGEAKNPSLCAVGSRRQGGDEKGLKKALSAYAPFGNKYRG